MNRTTRIKYVGAGRNYRCALCRRSILIGHRYERVTLFPDGEVVTGHRPDTMHVCLVCRVETDSGAVLTFGACGTFCHALNPCALRVHHQGDHSCCDRSHQEERP